MTGAAEAELRRLVREVLADAMATRSAAPETGPRPLRPVVGEPDWTAPPAVSEPSNDLAVRVDDDAALHSLVLRVLAMAEDPQRRADLRSGRVRFRLAPGARRAAVGGGDVQQPVHRVERGAVTESAVSRAGESGARLVLGRRAVLTPLARDRARSLGVDIERER